MLTNSGMLVLRRLLAVDTFRSKTAIGKQVAELGITQYDNLPEKKSSLYVKLEEIDG